MGEKSYWLGFSMVKGIGPKKFEQLLVYFGSAKDAWDAPLSDLKESKIGNGLAEQFVAFRTNFSITSYEELLHAKGVSYMIVGSESYPQGLAMIHNPPFVLYVKGNYEILNPSFAEGYGGARQVQAIGSEVIDREAQTESAQARRDDPPSYKASEGQGKMVAIVGTRKVTGYGRQVTELFTRELVDAGCVIVSGLALGVDAVAHQVTLDCGGKTVAVLGCGVDCCYPRENERIYKQIIEQGGAIVSEYGLGMPPNQGSFPSRNRIIAGLSRGVLVTEGAVDSGSLITAKDAFENNRPVFAVPGPITSTLSKGPYELLQKGGKLVVSAKDVLEALDIKGIRSIKGIKSIKGDSAEEQVIIDLLVEQEMHFDEIVKKTKIPPATIGGILSLMEMKGLVGSSDGVFRLV